jgi:hypothetical protein
MSEVHLNINKTVFQKLHILPSSGDWFSIHWQIFLASFNDVKKLCCISVCYISFLWVILWCCQNLDYIASKVRMAEKWWVRKDLEGNDNGLIEVLFWHLPGGTEENHKKSESISSISDRPTCLVYMVNLYRLTIGLTANYKWRWHFSQCLHYQNSLILF